MTGRGKRRGSLRPMWEAETVGLGPTDVTCVTEHVVLVITQIDRNQTEFWRIRTETEFLFLFFSFAYFFFGGGGEVEKDSFITLPGKGGHTELLPRKTMCPNPVGFFFS